MDPSDPPLVAPSYNHSSEERIECAVVGALCFAAGLVVFGLVILMALWS